MGLMNGYYYNSPWAPPPHRDVEAHERLMEYLEQMTPDEFFQSLVRAGIYTPEGELTEHYRSEPSLPPQGPQGS
jgi:hypothetical protein